MSINLSIKRFFDNKEENEIEKIIEKNSEYDVYVFLSKSKEELDYINDKLLEYKLVNNKNHLSRDTDRHLYYITRNIKNHGSNNMIDNYRLFMISDTDFFYNKFNNMYPDAKKYPNVIEFSDFNKWLEYYLQSLIGNLYKPRKFVYEYKIKHFNEFINEKRG